MGASVTNIGSQLGWNEQQSQLTVSLAEDPLNGDLFLPPPVGTPIYFQFYGFTFYGLLQKWVKKSSPEGLPTYQVICVDPRGLLEATQVIVRDYSGATDAVANLLNAYGFWEDPDLGGGFGGSFVNEAGMPWYLVLQAVEAMANTPDGTPYGGPITNNGFAYSLDLSELPVPPSYYRVGASDSLMTMIAQVCQDGGCDFFVELDGYTITVRTVSRYAQPALGTISAIANSDWGGTLMSSDNGLEWRNDYTSSFLVGGEVASLFLADQSAFQSFWGFDPLGFPIVGTPETLTINGIKVEVETMTLNSSEVAYVLGGTGYPCNTLEIRCALTNQETWAAYIAANRPDINQILGGVCSPYMLQPAKEVLQEPGDLINDSPDYAKFLDAYVVTDDPLVRQTALWQFVRKAGEQYMGRTFLVNIPFVALKQVPETLQIVFSEQPSDAGYLPEGSEPLGLADYNEDFFLTEDGRMQGFAFFDGRDAIDLLRLQSNEAALQPNGVYMKATVQPQVYLNPLPCVVVELPSPVYAVNPDFVGDINSLAAVLQTEPDQLGNAMQDITAGSLNLLISPSYFYPSNLAVPLRSNIQSYGPWYVSGPAGKVLYEYDQSFVPWNFGGYDEMDNAAMSRVVNAVTFMQESETGHIEVAGTPNWSLGDVMQAGGPNITNINVSYGSKGVSTQVEMQTFSTRFGVFSKQNADRIKRLGQTAMQARKWIRQLGRYLWMYDVTGAIAQAGASFNETLAGTLKVARPQTPHTTLAMRIFPVGSSDYRVTGASMTAEEMIRAARANNPDIYQQTALMSWSGLFRPFSTNSSASGIAHYQQPSGYGYPNAITTTNQNPFGTGHDIEWLSSGSGYNGLRTFRTPPDASNSRAIGLRAPLILSGYGWGIDGYAYPGGSGTNGRYVADVMNRSDLWKTGVLDALWDDNRGVWTVHDALTVIIPSGTIFPGYVKVYDPVAGVDTGTRIYADEWGPPTVDTSVGDVHAVINYVATGNRWFVASTPQTGYTGTQTIVTGVTCSGNSLVVTTMQFTWKNGLLEKIV